MGKKKLTLSLEPASVSIHALRLLLNQWTAPELTMCQHISEPSLNWAIYNLIIPKE
jgi:hypothetical protein